MASSRRKSPVWEYFDLPVIETLEGKSSKKYVICKLCNSKLVDGGGTGNLFTHLHSRHPQEYKLCTGDDDGKRKQTTIERFTGKCNDERASEVTKHICEFVAEISDHSELLKYSNNGNYNILIVKKIKLV